MSDDIYPKISDTDLRNTDLMMGRVTPAASRDPASGPQDLFPVKPVGGLERLEQPPLGVVPRWLWEENQRSARIAALTDASIRYFNAGKDIPQAWVDEVRDLQAQQAAKEAEAKTGDSR